MQRSGAGTGDDAGRGARADGYAKGRERRRLILDEAVRLFGESGYRAASLRELAARCGLSHAGLLHHVGSKQALLLAVLEHRDALDAAEFALVERSGADRLHALVEVACRNAARPGIVELFTVLSAEATAPGHPARAFFAERYACTVEQVRSAFADCAHPDPASAARRLVAVMDGLQVQWLLDRDGLDMAVQVEQHLAAELARVPQAGTGDRGPQPGG
ncbi:TetR/AcrR family transcriptional regulator [Paenibacillus sp. TRM 82003]|uniref:TetR/AcrR family transcriptional regulator n=1 Tax=Kineococcus sp. TRM81007 TaxID=2925831 RepID=UPI001F5678F9|nr:TetR/AcrR family transcriptional regulator [Kineococcus sp. TRM81007]MCI2240079.1 TetR/AcrR family transcriptional regulator [Kineococcus sp. TRM81007]MCI3925615.1 TetR/AcrR family transcriptional regulator [Paenibacillus sp. TRM 82003]